MAGQLRVDEITDEAGTGSPSFPVGNVGIGTSSPLSGTRLTVSGAVASNGGLSADLVSAISLDFSGGEGRIISQGSSGNSAPITFRNGASGSGTTERMRIDSAGRVTKPFQPSAALGRGTAFTSTSSIIPWDVVHHNIGNHYNSSTGVFTCPVAGRYLVSVMAMTNETNITLDINLHLNGAVNNQLVPFQAATGGLYNQVSGMTVVLCAANDTLALVLNQGNIFGGGGGRHSAAVFMLIG